MFNSTNLHQQILDNYYFQAPRENDPYIIIARTSTGEFQAWVLDKSSQDNDRIAGDTGATPEAALYDLFVKTCERVQLVLIDESSGGSDASA